MSCEAPSGVWGVYEKNSSNSSRRKRHQDEQQYAKAVFIAQWQTGFILYH